jgi:hypothetical protein
VKLKTDAPPSGIQATQLAARPSITEHQKSALPLCTHSIRSASLNAMVCPSLPFENPNFTSLAVY